MPILEGFRNAFKIQELRNRILFTLGVLIVFRVGSHIPVPGVNIAFIDTFREQMKQSVGGAFGLLQVFSGSAFGNLALFTLGIMPYITASIIMQLMTKVSPTLEEIQKEGPAGQRKIGQYTRYLSIPICLIQAGFAVRLLSMTNAAEIARGNQAWLVGTGFGWTLVMVSAFCAGALFIMWLGEQVTERGMGNGASVLIMAGILSQIPSLVGYLLDDVKSALAFVGVFVLFVAVIVGVVFVTQAQRRIPIQHAKHFKGRRVMMGARNYLPIKVNTAGVMPVIFAGSLVMLPQLLSMIPGLGGLANVIGYGNFIFVVIYCSMIFFFSYFWTYLFFQPQEMANNLKEYGSFIPGIRPGEMTAKFIDAILSRITLFGAAFLCVIALTPDLLSLAMQVEKSWLQQFLGGTGMLIVVGVALDLAQKTDSYLIMHQYGGFLGGAGAIRGRR